jgi:acyl-CoA hydrolase
LRGVEISQIHTEGPAPYAQERYRDSFFVNAFFTGANTRAATQVARAGYVPCFLSEVPNMFADDLLPIDVALLNLSPPDKHGYCSLGPSLDVSLAAARSAKIIIAFRHSYSYCANAVYGSNHKCWRFSFWCKIKYKCSNKL